MNINFLTAGFILLSVLLGVLSYILIKKSARLDKMEKRMDTIIRVTAAHEFWIESVKKRAAEADLRNVKNRTR